MSAPVFVVDTNVVVAGLLTTVGASPVAIVLDGMLTGLFPYLLSPALLAEYRRVLLRPRLVKLHGLSEAEVDRLLLELTANAMWREPTHTRSAPDPGDDHPWALLDAHASAALITGDQLLIAHPPSGRAVMSPSDWLGRHGLGGARRP